MHLKKQLDEKINYLEAEQIEQINQAYQLALESHKGQSRESGEQYITHPVAVASILAEMHIDYQSIIAALLHDVIEDTPTTKETITALFGQTVAELVDGITKLTKIETASRAETQAQSFRKMLLAMSRDIRVILIKLADRLHNMQTLDRVTPHKRYRIAKETLSVYAPIANRLSMYEIYVQLENLAFVALYPHRYSVLKKAMEQAETEHKKIVQTLKAELAKALHKNHLKNCKIISRTKHLYSIYKKMVRHRTSFANIMDVLAFRIIVATVDDCYRALGITHSLYKPMPGKFKDYISIPKSNGYQSLHTVLFGPHGVPIEIQIRTQAMDQMANSGIAAHWLYKSKDTNTSAAHVRAQQWVNNLLEMQQNTSSSLEFFENVKVDLFPDEVYVFTPKGNIMELPRGATAVDFAYAVHTDIGNTCVATRIDHKFLPLSTTLFNGQIVSIITSPSAKPNPAWLNFVTTGKARSSIRSYLKNQKRSQLIALGKQLLNKACNELQLNFSSIPTKVINTFLKQANLPTLHALYEDIGMGNHFATFVAHQLAHASEQHPATLPVEEHKPLLIHGAEGMAITFASCCYPIPGDLIVGFFNKGHGLDIHTKECVNITKLRQHPENYLPVRWANNVTGDFRTVINVEMVHQRGGLAILTKTTAAANAIIDDLRISERSGGYCLVTLYLLVKNLAHLERTIRYIGATSVVIGVSRKQGN